VRRPVGHPGAMMRAPRWLRWPPWGSGNGEATQRATEAVVAKQRANKELRRVEQQWPEVHRATKDLDKLGAAIERAMRGQV
jgi:hypothetical protein